MRKDRARLLWLASVVGGMALLTGCRTLGAGCLKPPDGANAVDGQPLRVPVGLDPVDTREALKIPSLESPAPAPASFSGPCLEYPPQIEPLPDPVAAERREREEARSGRGADSRKQGGRDRMRYPR